MHVIARKTLKSFVESLEGHKDQNAVKNALDAWYQEAKAAKWKSSADVKDRYAHASIINAERVVFNIKGNDYRLVVAINYKGEVVFIKWIGTHKAYDEIDAATVKHDV